MSTNKRSLLPLDSSRFEFIHSHLLSIIHFYCQIYYSFVRKYSQLYCQDCSTQFSYIRMSDDSHSVNTFQLFNKQMNYKYIIMTFIQTTIYKQPIWYFTLPVSSHYSSKQPKQYKQM